MAESGSGGSRDASSTFGNVEAPTRARVSLRRGQIAGIFVVALLVASALVVLVFQTPQSGTCTTCNLGDIDAGFGPYEEIYDNASGSLFVLDSGPGHGWGVTVINGTSDTVAKFLPLNQRPGTFTYDSRNGDLYVTDFCFNNGIFVLNGSTGANVSWIPTPAQGNCNGPFALAFDPVTRLVYAALSNPASLLAINGSTNQVVASYTLSPAEMGPGNPIVVNLATGSLYVTTGPASLVQFYLSVVNGWNGSVESSLLVNGSSPTLTYDPLTGHVYVVTSTLGYGTSNLEGTLLTLDEAATRILASTPVGYLPYEAAADSANGDIYVTNTYSNNISVVNGTTSRPIGSVPVDPDPWSIVYDARNRCLYPLFETHFSGGAAQGDGYLTVIAPPGSDCVPPPTSSVPYWTAPAVLFGLAVVLSLVMAVAGRRRSAGPR